MAQPIDIQPLFLPVTQGHDYNDHAAAYHGVDPSLPFGMMEMAFTGTPRAIAAAEDAVRRYDSGRMAAFEQAYLTELQFRSGFESFDGRPLATRQWLLPGDELALLQALASLPGMEGLSFREAPLIERLTRQDNAAKGLGEINPRESITRRADTLLQPLSPRVEGDRLIVRQALWPLLSEGRDASDYGFTLANLLGHMQHATGWMETQLRVTGITERLGQRVSPWLLIEAPKQEEPLHQQLVKEAVFRMLEEAQLPVHLMLRDETTGARLESPRMSVRAGESFYMPEHGNEELKRLAENTRRALALSTDFGMELHEAPPAQTRRGQIQWGKKPDSGTGAESLRSFSPMRFNPEFPAEGSHDTSHRYSQRFCHAVPDHAYGIVSIAFTGPPHVLEQAAELTRAYDEMRLWKFEEEYRKAYTSRPEAEKHTGDLGLSHWLLPKDELSLLRHIVGDRALDSARGSQLARQHAFYAGTVARVHSHDSISRGSEDLLQPLSPEIRDGKLCVSHRVWPRIPHDLDGRDAEDTVLYTLGHMQRATGWMDKHVKLIGTVETNAVGNPMPLVLIDAPSMKEPAHKMLVLDTVRQMLGQAGIQCGGLPRHDVMPSVGPKVEFTGSRQEAREVVRQLLEQTAQALSLRAPNMDLPNL